LATIDRKGVLLLKHQDVGPRKFLVFTNAGDHSSVAPWVECGGRKFDLYINFYGNNEGEKSKLRDIADKFRVGKGHKYNCLAYWLSEEPDLLDQYDAVAVLDDDMQHASSGKINALFQILMHEDLHWLSPSWTGKVYKNVNAAQPGSYLRYQTFFDMTFPFWNKDKLAGYLQQHDDRLRGFYEDLWSWFYLGGEKMNEGEKKRSAVVDAVIVHNPPHRSNGKKEEVYTDSISRDNAKKVRETPGFTQPKDIVTPIVPLNKMPPHIAAEAARCTDPSS